MGQKLVAEALGTAMLVFLGCGAAVLMGPQIGMAGVALAFGLAVVAAAYGLGPVSGAHLNPAVSLGMLVVGRMSGRDFAGYVVAQCLGALIGAGLLLAVASGHADYALAEAGLGQNGYGADYAGGYGLTAAALFELSMSFVFVTVVLGATANGSAQAGLAIGLTLAAIHLAGIDVTGVSVNPARSLGPALLVGGPALGQLWLFVVAPLAGGLLAGLAHAAGLTAARG